MKRVMTVAALAAATAVGVPTAQAGVSSYEERALPYYFQNDEYAVFTLPSFEEGCRGEGYETHRVHIVQPTDDRIIAHSRYTDTLALYDLSDWGASSAEELLGIACDAVFNDGVVPQPIATGEGNLTYHSKAVDLAPGKFVDREQRSVKGDLTSDDGEVYSVRGRDKRTTTYANGAPSDEEVTFSTLDVR